MKLRIFKGTMQTSEAEMDLQIFLANTPTDKIYQIDTFYSRGDGTLVFVYYEQ